ncbi:MAG: M13 family metallopeptidase [Bacteroidales bacterium]|nr:M13 family metallopeptidase [Bacteroidales bacterium]MDY2671675.1 M13 family metallopeptidase [Sodaliphilus sp.]MDD7095039.1 M13 family metallopeptidase [Bacteroidales bacterium]MDD7717804.1 M13 family metallopeptidase [Bacteroidales bacterium]MDY3135856.1 M13 family metallopeptidase [Sodaliphilus sp.]
MMKKITMVAALAVAALAADAQAPAAAQGAVHGVNKADMDMSVRPGDDFYQYAGGGWLKANPMKPEYSSYGVFNDLAETNRKQIRELFENLSKEKHAFGSVGQKVADLYNMAMDSVRLNKEGAAPLQKDLDKVKAFSKKADFTAFIADQHLYKGNPFFGIGVDTDLKNSDLNVMWLSAGTSGLPDRDYYLNTDADSKKKQEAYRAYLSKIFQLSGYKKKEAEKAAKVIYNIEYQFAEAKMSRAEARDYNKLYNIYTIDMLQKDYPAIQWAKYFELMGVKDVKQVILTEPKVMAVAQKLMSTLSEQDIKYYVAGLIIKSSTSVLSDDFVNANFDFYGRLLNGQKEQKARWKRALGFPNSLLGEAVGELYVSKYFAGESKAKMLKLIDNLRKALATRIANLTWMNDTTKINALVKLNSFTVKVGYPDKWRDYSKLTIDPAKSLYDNVAAATYVETLRNLEKFGKPVDKSEWGMTPQTVNAYYNPTTNEICFPAAILQAPFFDVNADDATNYGAIGVVIGHEMTHGFDDQGRNFNADGNMVDWWTAGDSKRFTAAAEKLAAQFDQITVVGDLKANGHLTLGENIADQGGLRISYDAFKTTQQFQEGKEIDGFTPAQRFYLSYGRIWAEHMTEEAIYQQTKSDPHSIGRNRVNATLRNIDTWYDAFGVKEGDKMWLAPAERAIVW